MKEFKDKVAVVTGAASGIGRGMAETFTAAGMEVVLSDIETQALEETTRLRIEQRMHEILTGNNPAVVPSPEWMQKLNALRPR
jgi:NADP-dependent 3-hydroxy acid dehydrogenase YdfG